MDDSNTNYLAHYGILGMQWGVRRYQNADGSLTPRGRARYGLRPVSRDPKKLKSKIMADVKKHNKKVKAKEAAKENTEAHKRIDITIQNKERVKRFSDEELKRYTDRLRLENEYLKQAKEYDSYFKGKMETKTALDKINIAATASKDVSTIVGSYRKVFGEKKKNN